MTKQDLQKELLEKVKPGTKPSQLKKFRRSKSLSDIASPESTAFPKAPPLPNLARSKSAQELETTNSKIEQLETKISTLELKLEVSRREIDGLAVDSRGYQQQITEKDIEIGSLQKQLTNPSKELDQNLTKRHQNLKDWFSQYQKTKQLDQELSENIDQASTELINQDQVITSLRVENSKLKQTNTQLAQDLKLTQRLAELRSNEGTFDNGRQLRKEPLTFEKAWLPTPSGSWSLITFALTLFALWIWTGKNYD